jgi:site-specific DNA recombinase
MKAGLYKRISTGEQSKYSLEAQEEQLKKYCGDNNIDVFRVYQDTKGRFTFEERSGLMQLLDDIEKGRINILLVTELDRLAGDEGILGYIKYTIKKNNVSLVSINEQDKVKNEYQELIESILTAVAKFENKRKKLRCRRGIARAKQEGKTLNRCPFGYKFINKGKRNSSLDIDEQNSKIVIEIFDRYVNKNQSMYIIAKD